MDGALPQGWMGADSASVGRGEGVHSPQPLPPPALSLVLQLLRPHQPVSSRAHVPDLGLGLRVSVPYTNSSAFGRQLGIYKKGQIPRGAHPYPPANVKIVF